MLTAFIDYVYLDNLIVFLNYEISSIGSNVKQIGAIQSINANM